MMLLDSLIELLGLHAEITITYYMGWEVKIAKEHGGYDARLMAVRTGDSIGRPICEAAMTTKRRIQIDKEQG